ncbi:MAG TPA: arsenite methyltransferase [Rubrobacter sp.]|nr:arsenite methyltransferase [Rubrobacter sp.]
MEEDLKQRVRDRYAGAARSVLGEAEDGGSCCGDGASCCEVAESGERAVFEVDMVCGSYSEAERSELPQLAADASLGCGNPVALATLSPGEVVLDLGSGGGIDVLLSARRVAPGGRAYGLDMTDEMLELARRNQAEAGVENAEFLKWEIEDVPLPDGHVDVVISNCVINLSTEKQRVISEAFRVLKPGGRFAVSDVVFLGEKNKLPPGVARSVELWSGCVSGALEKGEYEALLSGAGFEDVAVEGTHTYPPEQIAGLSGEDVEALREVPAASAFIRASKPEAL